MAAKGDPPRRSSTAARRSRASGDIGDGFGLVVIPPQLGDRKARPAWGMPADPRRPSPYILELNVLHASGLDGAAKELADLYRAELEESVAGASWRRSPDSQRPRRVGKTYFAVKVPFAFLKRLVARDGKEAAARAPEGAERRFRVIHRVWPDFELKALVDASVATIKADAARRSFAAAGAGIVWAVVDSGVDAGHRHFAGGAEASGGRKSLGGAVEHLHRCFCAVPGTAEEGGGRLRLPDPDGPAADGEARLSTDERTKLIVRHVENALRDELGHGTHVAGIISGGLGKDAGPDGVVRLERRLSASADGAVESRRVAAVPVHDASALCGVAPACQLISLRVLDDNGRGYTSDVIRALEYIRESLNDDPKLLRVHGVNLSVGYEFDAEMFACGQSPICAEVDRLVRAGVVVVAAAGNTGYGTAIAQARSTKVCLSNTINDPGNAERAITVGATHRDSPHTYGVSYFSSKGPTGDGRLKPDLVAPGERITSCGAGRKLETARAALGNGLMADSEAVRPAYYLEDSGTSMAAPHVSGAIACFLSIRREFIGKPEEVKRIFLESATPLGRERYFEGHGMVDLMRAIQSV